jgi:HD-GYP domain-containing protein (c-di-GMP phosphodiesterase class II)
MAIKKIPISLLVPGMYVTKLDISWIDSPFMYHHLMIKSKSQIDKLLKAGVKQITIDTSKGKDVQSDPAAVSTESSSAESGKNQEQLGEEVAEPQVQEAPKPTSIDQEIGVAKELKGQVEKLAEDINQALKNDEAVNSAQVSPLIDGTLSSLQRNNQALATLINIQRKDASLATHTFATFSLVLSLALKLGVSDEDREALALAAFFHDTGWLKLPLHLLGKKTSYSPSEFKLVQQHVAIGLKSLKQNCDLSDVVMRIIKEHHEQLDGKGYPAGLKSEQIHPLSKMFSVVVRYDELVHGLADKAAITPNGALAALYKQAKMGVLEEKPVTSLISLLSVYPVGSAVQLSNKEKGVVLETDSDEPKLPTVKVFYDMSGMAHIKPKVINLAKHKSEKQLIIASVLDISEPGIDPANLLTLDA